MNFRFGTDRGYMLDAGARELRRHGVPIAIEPKVFDLLELLLRHPNRALPRKLIIRDVWPGVTVGQCSLSRLVKEARRAIGDDGTSQSMIRTVRGMGYRFVGPVECDRAPDVRIEGERLIARAREALETSIDRGPLDLRIQVEEFVRTCELALDRACG